MKKRSLALGILLGIAVVVSMGIVYIDTIQNYWYVNGGFVKLIVSNQTDQAIFTVDTNTLRVGFNTNNTARSFVVTGRKPATNTTGNGTSAATTGRIQLNGGSGGESTTANDASGGAGGFVGAFGGNGGMALGSSNNATGGSGGGFGGTGGNGGAAGAIATNSVTGGNGGTASITGGQGGAPTIAATNTVGGNGGAITSAAADGAVPTAGWARKGGNGGDVAFMAGSGASSVRTNGGNGGGLAFTAGNSGGATTTPGSAGTPGAINFTAGNSGSAVAGGNPQPGAIITLTAGAGSTGDTNSDGGHVFIAGGAPGSGAVPGNVVIARTSGGTSRGAGLQVGPFIAGGTATITNVLGGVAALDFPSTAAGTVSDIPIPVNGVTSNNCAVSLSVPWQSTFGNGGIFTTFNSNDAIYVRFANNNLVTAIDPEPGSFVVVAFRIR